MTTEEMELEEAIEQEHIARHAWRLSQQQLDEARERAWPILYANEIAKIIAPRHAANGVIQ